MISNKTYDIIKRLPYWFSAKHLGNEDSTTFKFLNVFGGKIQELFDVIDFAYNLSYLDTFENKDYYCYKTITKKPRNVTIGTSKATELEDFYFVKSCVELDPTYTYDKKHEILYVSNPNNLNVIVDGVDITSRLSKHLVWNANIIDEYGLELDMPRLEGESNKEYTNRLLEYTRTKANSSIIGLSSFIGHTYGLYKVIEWVDGSKDILIEDELKISRVVFVDDEPFYNSTKISENALVLKGDENLKGIPRKIKYFRGFDLHNLNTVDNITAYNNYFNSNNTATKDLEDLFDKAITKCPIMWGTARWGESYWLEDEDELLTIAPTFDPDISCLKVN